MNVHIESRSDERMVAIRVDVLRKDGTGEYVEPIDVPLDPQRAIAVAHSLLLAAWTAEHGQRPSPEQVRNVLRWAL